jgi:cation diffusion facilitator family transporter
MTEHSYDQEHGHDHDRAPGVLAAVRSLFEGHHHDHGVVDATVTATDEGMRALKISLAVLALTAALQALVVAASGSVALLADTIHNGADALTAIPLGVAFWLGRRPPTRRYTFGFGRAEDLAGVAIVATIAASSAIAAWEGVSRLAHPRDVQHLGWVAVAGIVGFAGNELVAVYRIRVGRRIGSAALVADGLHARTDGLTSLAVILGAAGVAAGWQLADPVVGLVITAAIARIVVSAGRDMYRRLMDAVDPELVDRVENVVAAVPGVEAVEGVRIRWIGHELQAEVEVVSDEDLSLSAAHEIAEQVHHRLLHDVPRLSRAVIHTSPCGHGGRDHHAATAHHFGGRRTSD